MEGLEYIIGTHDELPNSSKVEIWLPFTSSNVHQLVIDVGYWTNQMTISINQNQIYSGRRRETQTSFDITQYLTTSPMRLTFVAGGYTSNMTSPTKFTTIR